MFGFTSVRHPLDLFPFIEILLHSVLKSPKVLISTVLLSLLKSPKWESEVSLVPETKVSMVSFILLAPHLKVQLYCSPFPELFTLCSFCDHLCSFCARVLPLHFTSTKKECN